MPRPEYKSISIPTKIYEILQKQYTEEADELLLKNGISSFSGYLIFRLNQIIEETPDQFEMINHDGQGVKVWDKKLKRTADINITPKGIYCPLCDARGCEHIRYALKQPDIQNIIKEKRQEGWRLPDV
jgi:hypothetical protein